MTGSPGEIERLATENADLHRQIEASKNSPALDPMLQFCNELHAFMSYMFAFNAHEEDDMDPTRPPKGSSLNHV